MIHVLAMKSLASKFIYRVLGAHIHLVQCSTALSPFLRFPLPTLLWPLAEGTTLPQAHALGLFVVLLSLEGDLPQGICSPEPTGHRARKDKDESFETFELWGLPPSDVSNGPIIRK